MPYIPTKLTKVYYSIGEVAKMFDVNIPVSQFFRPSPPITNSGTGLRELGIEMVLTFKLLA